MSTVKCRQMTLNFLTWLLYCFAETPVDHNEGKIRCRAGQQYSDSEIRLVHKSHPKPCGHLEHKCGHLLQRSFIASRRLKHKCGHLLQRSFIASMSQRHFLRRGYMELSSPAFQGESATHESTGDGNEEVGIRAGSNLPTFSSSRSQREQLQQLREGEQDPLLLNSAAVTKRRFSLLDIFRETFHLVLARRTYLFVFLPIFIVGLFLVKGFYDYLIFGTSLEDSNEAARSCEKNILQPWKEGVVSGNLTSVQSKEFYSLFQENCTMFKSPAEELGFVSFLNGTVTLTSPTGFTRPHIKPQLVPHLIGSAMTILWFSWGHVAVTWGLHFATTRTMAYRPPEYRGSSMQTKGSQPSQTVMEVCRELFAFRVLQGVIRATLTEFLSGIIWVISEYFIRILKFFVENKSLNNVPSFDNITSLPQSYWWQLANPVPFLFLLSSPSAALEPRMWGFRALWSGVQMAKGNRLKSFVIYLMLFFSEWLQIYLHGLVAFISEQGNESPWGAFWRSIKQGSFGALSAMPRLFLVPVLYFLCKSWRERLSTMA